MLPGAAHVVSAPGQLKMLASYSSSKPPKRSRSHHSMSQTQFSPVNSSETSNVPSGSGCSSVSA